MPLVPLTHIVSEYPRSTPGFLLSVPLRAQPPQLGGPQPQGRLADFGMLYLILKRKTFVQKVHLLLTRLNGLVDLSHYGFGYLDSSCFSHPLVDF